MFRLISATLMIGAFTTFTASGSELGSPAVKSIESIDIEESQRRDELLADLASSNATVTFYARAELSGGYSNDPVVIAALIDIIAKGASASEVARRETLTLRENALELLITMADASWTPTSVARASAVIERYRTVAATGRTPDLRMLGALDQRLAGLSGVRSAYGEVQGFVEGKTQFTDVDVFICASQTQNAPLVLEARSFAEALARDKFGRVRLRESTESLEKQLGPQQGATTVYLDKNHPETEEAGRIADIVAKFELPAVKSAANPGSPSFWYVSLFVCP